MFDDQSVGLDREPFVMGAPGFEYNALRSLSSVGDPEGLSFAPIRPEGLLSSLSSPALSGKSMARQRQVAEEELRLPTAAL